MIISVIAVIIFFVILIVPHEFGHFAAAKLLGVRVNEFAFGMGPAIFKKQGEETLYSIRAFPIGGYCALEGENEDTGDPKAFNSKPGWVKILILVAGVTMNVITAFLILFTVILFSTRDPLKAVQGGFEMLMEMGGLIFEGLRSMFGGGVTLNDFSGPVGIVSMVNETVSQNIVYYLVFTAAMSVNLAIINILPLPALDGGRILFVIIRKVTGKMISDELEAKIHGIGMALLLLLILVITFNDVFKAL